MVLGMLRISWLAVGGLFIFVSGARVWAKVGAPLLTATVFSLEDRFRFIAHDV